MPRSLVKMSKKQILEELQKKLNISKEKAEKLFDKAVESGEIRLRLNWKKLMDYFVILLLAISGTYALFNIVVLLINL